MFYPTFDRPTPTPNWWLYKLYKVYLTLFSPLFLLKCSHALCDLCYLILYLKIRVINCFFFEIFSQANIKFVKFHQNVHYNMKQITHQDMAWHVIPMVLNIVWLMDITRFLLDQFFLKEYCRLFCVGSLSLKVFGKREMLIFSMENRFLLTTWPKKLL